MGYLCFPPLPSGGPISRSLTYFDFVGSRGLECRLALSVAGLPFEDDRIQIDQWRTLKGTVPFGALPIYTEDGRSLSQSTPILLYIGRAHGLHPVDPWTAAEHEALMASVEDFREKVSVAKGLTDEQKQQAREAFAAGWMAQWAQTVSDRIVGPFIEGDALQVADLKLYVILRSTRGGIYDHIAPTALDAWPKLSALFAAVEQHPGVSGWLAGAE